MTLLCRPCPRPPSRLSNPYNNLTCTQVVGKHTYSFKDDMKAQFESIRYLDLMFNGGTVTKSAWILPVEAQTESTGTLAALLRKLGAKVTEVDLSGRG